MDKTSPVLLKIHSFVGEKFLQWKALKSLFCKKSTGSVLHQSESQRRSRTYSVPSSRSEGSDFTCSNASLQ